MKTDMMPVRQKIPGIDSVKTGEKFRAARESMGLMLQTVADRMDISMTYLSELERGRRNWSDSLVEKFQKALAKND
jgi:transcriptional regulator with XRE-family HTH domain